MQIQISPMAIVKPQAFPDTIPQHKSAIIDADHRLRFGHKRAINIDQNVIIARILFGLMRGLCVIHGAMPPRLLCKLPKQPCSEYLLLWKPTRIFVWIDPRP